MATSGIVLPKPGERNILITSALPYVNNIPHLGNIIGSVLPADVFARFCRARGLNTLYVCGSDQYGTASEAKAVAEGIDPATLCNKYHIIHKDIYDWFRIEFDIFGQTPTSQHTEIVQAMFADLWKNGYIEERETIQPFCAVENHSSFLADRFIEGECSICHAPDARGDQCDTCGNLMDPFEPDNVNESGTKADTTKGTGWLINPHCKLDGSVPQKRKTKHLYLKLDSLKHEIEPWFKSTSPGWSSNSAAITQSWIDNGLQPRAISRDLKWGVPIPNVEGMDYEEYKNKVFYVWFDACIGYVSITKNYTDGKNLDGKFWEKWWKDPENVELYQFMGKDNVPFHTIVFPASQLGAQKNQNYKWTKVKTISAADYLNYEGGKFSKSKNIGVFGNQTRETGTDPDLWRFYLLSRRPESGSDTEFQWEEFISANNNELLKNIGNLVQRVIKFTHAKMDGIVPEYEIIPDHVDQVNHLLKEYINFLEENKQRAGLMTVLQISGLGNKLLQDNKLDNKLFTEDRAKCNTVIGLALNHIHLVASLLSPYMPSTSASILTQLGVGPTTTSTSTSTSTSSPANPTATTTTTSSPTPFHIPTTWPGTTLRAAHRLGAPASTPLFSLIPAAAKLAEWKDRFGGDELQRQKAAEAEKKAAKKAAKEAQKARKKARKAGEGEGEGEGAAVAVATDTVEVEKKMEKVGLDG